MFYLPIFVNLQRMHVLHMVSEAPYEQLAHSFVMCSMHDYEVISFPSDRAQLICDSGENMDLREMDFSLERLADSPYAAKYPNMPCYRLDIYPGNGKTEVHVEKMYLDGHIGNGFTDSDGYLKIVAGSKLQDKEYILEVRYKHTEQSHGTTEVEYYSAAIRVYTYKEEKKEVCTAALDFGSEASQVHFKDDEGNMNLREAFCRLAGYDEKADYWQGRYSDTGEQLTLYKSIYHIHTRPGKTFLGDLPMNNEKKTFIQSLLRVDNKDYSHLVLLPNLKLIELLNYEIHSLNVDFGSPENTDLIPSQSDSLGSRELRQNVLRQILCNFLAVIMYNKRRTGAHNMCLRFTLLVPNVYYQSKVSTIIDGLYEDFDTLCRNHPEKFGCYRGIEIQTISESDASYFGVHSTNEQAQKGAYRLIIDAGKGTTDFSLLHQTGEVLSHYESVYRSGIPASGHVLTYAFYEALRDYFEQIGKADQFEQIIRSAYAGERQTQHLLSFVSALEEQKMNYGKFIEVDNEEMRSIAESVVNWTNLIGFLKWLNDSKLTIPNTTQRVKEKVESMINLLDTSIIQYAQDHQIQLLKVYLSGRAFRFKPFREALEKKLVERGLVASEHQIEFNDSFAKTACLTGAVAESEHTVNRKSIMLSVPTMQENVGQVRGLRRTFRHLLRRDRIVSANVDFDFFYEGIKKGNVTNVDIDICGRVFHRGDPAGSDAYLYFVGNGYLLKYGNQNGILPEGVNSRYNCDLDTLNKLMHESLFPFDVESMGYRREASQESSQAERPASIEIHEPSKPAEEQPVEEMPVQKPVVEKPVQKPEQKALEKAKPTKPKSSVSSSLDD